MANTTSVPIRQLVFSSESGFKLENNHVDFSHDGHDVLISPKFVGICGSDLQLIEGYKGDELLIGHEWWGVVERCGGQVTNISPGDIVTSGAFLGCGKCSHCQKLRPQNCDSFHVLGSKKNGALRSQFIIPEVFLSKLSPETKGGEEVLFEIMAIAYHALEQSRSVLNERKDVLILGAGALGLSCALEARRRGFETLVIEPISSRIERAQKLGLKALPLGMALLDPSLRAHFSVVIDASGDHLGGPGGWKHVPYFGAQGFYGIMLAKYLKEVTFPPSILAEKAAQLRWFRGCTPESLTATIEAWKIGIEEIAPIMISHEISFEESDRAFSIAQDRHASGKVVIRL
jgi:threonine dehydrogenase-like Zn-dependent dehydrogenase